MRAFTVAAVAAVAAAASSWSDDFSSYDSSKWTQVTEIEHCEDACVQDRVDHLAYGAAGLVMAMDQQPCNATKKSCCTGGKCADYASGHIVTAETYKYGTFQTSARIAHAPGGGLTPKNAFSCIGGYAYGAAVHNEISLCWEATTQHILGAAYWYDSKEHKTDIELPFDPSQGFHTYGVEWAADSITWMVDGKVVHTDTGKVGSTIPYEPMAFGFIIRPRSAPYDGDAAMSAQWFNWTSA